MQMEARSIAMPSNPLPPSYRRIEIAPLDAAFLIVVSLVSIESDRFFNLCLHSQDAAFIEHQIALQSSVLPMSLF